MSSTYSKKVTPSRVRKVAVGDYSNIYCQISLACARVPDAWIVKLADQKYAAMKIAGGHIPAVIIDEAFLVVYNVGSPWYAERTFLQELMVLRVGPGSSFDAVCDILEDLANEHDATEIIVGSALARHPRALSRMYQRRGYAIMDIPTLINRR